MVNSFFGLQRPTRISVPKAMTCSSLTSCLNTGAMFFLDFGHIPQEAWTCLITLVLSSRGYYGRNFVDRLHNSVDSDMERFIPPTFTFNFFFPPTTALPCLS